jgi:beta-lactamase class A
MELRMALVRRASLALLSSAAQFVLSSRAGAQDYFEQWPVELQTEVTHVYRTFNGEVTLYVKDLSTGFKYTHNSATPMYIASGVKMAVMVELFRQLKAKQVRFDEELIYGPMDVRDGAPVLSYLRQGTPVQIRILLEAMIQQSDNAATDMILRRIGVPNVNKGLVEEGIFGFGPITTLLDVRKLVYKEIDPRAMQLQPTDLMQIGVAENMEARLVKIAELLHEPAGTYTVADFDRAFKSYYRTGMNTAPLDAVGALLERLAKKKLVSEDASKQMLDVMFGTQTGSRRARAGFPPGTPFAHKTGTQYKRICDFGVFYMGPERPIVFAACVKGGQNRRRAEEVIAHLAQRTSWLLVPPEKRAPLPEASLQVPEVEDDETRVAVDPSGVQTKKMPHKVVPPPQLKPKNAKRLAKDKKRNGNAVD